MENRNHEKNFFGVIAKIFLWMVYDIYAFWYCFVKPVVKMKIFKLDWHQCYKDQQEFFNKALKLFGIEVVIENSHNVPLEGPYILVSNHRSWFDHVSLIAKMPLFIHYLANAKFLKIIFFGYGMKLYEFIPVADGALSPESSANLNLYLTRKDTVGFFVEGTRGSGQELLPFKPGAFKRAARCGCPILPLYILGSEAILSKRYSLITVKSGTIKIIIDPPVYFTVADWETKSREFEAEYRKKFSKLYEEFEATRD
ncbi:MAG TPA: lysophospholipid acyltransferase family protein [Bacillota bacterium]|nr:lysophospholipid acyltransferase family protein [Bacillota bacterium]